MKAKIITMILMVFASLVIAQTEENSLALRPSKGDLAVEVDFLPFSENGPINLNAFRGRMFFSQNMALRVGLNIDQNKKTDEVPRLYNEDGNNILKFDSYKMDYFVWGLQAGAEYHLLKNTRVSPYLGFDLGFETKSSNYEDEKNSRQYNYPGYSYEVTKTTVDNAWWNPIIYYDPYGDPYYDYNLTERAYTAWNLNLVAGTDIYIIKHFYAGFEIGLGLQTLKYKEVVVKEDVILLKYKASKDNTFGFNFNNAIRLGFWF